MILVVTYDLRSPKDYHEFYEAVKLQGKWWHYMASTWLLSTTKTPTEVVDAIFPHMDPQDLLFVCELTNKYQGRLPKVAWDWIKAELPEYNYWAALHALAGPPTMPPTPARTIAELLGGTSPTKEDPASILPWLNPPPKK
jgi:hypothetical protein